jgi:hypothetical protein
MGFCRRKYLPYILDTHPEEASSVAGEENRERVKRSGRDGLRR